jgi:two-component system, chemotaxis family, chemotaxis protein CheY
MRCLVVDESATTRRIVRNVLTDLGADEVIEQTDGREALAQIEGTLDLVVTGRVLPGFDGIELTRRLREKPQTAQVPILMIALRGTHKDVTMAREAGVTSYLIKPLTADNLRSRIEMLTRTEVEEEAEAPAPGATAEAA